MISPARSHRSTAAGLALALLALLALCAGCAGRFRRVPVESRWLCAPHPRELPAPGDQRPLRVAVYGDTRGDRAAHRRVVAAIRASHPDLVVFTGDALESYPLGHLPDLGFATYLIPLWPQIQRGYPAFALATLIPFPALVHEVLVGPFLAPRDPEGFNAFLGDTAPLREEDRIPFLFVPGNHDLYYEGDRRDVARLFGSPCGAGGHDPRALWFHLDTAGLRLIVLDTGTDLFGARDPIATGAPQLQWLERTLAEGEALGRRQIVFCHLPPFSSAIEEGSVPQVQENIVRSILDRHRVDLVVSGHAHTYERIVRPGRDGKPVTYLVTGGGGAPLHRARAPRERERGSQVIATGIRHFVLLQITPEAIAGRLVPLSAGISPPGAHPEDAFCLGAGADR